MLSPALPRLPCRQQSGLPARSPNLKFPTVTCCIASFLEVWGGGVECGQASFSRPADMGVSLDFGLEILLGAVFWILS